MTLNKVIKNEIALVVYEERDFEIHVHEGVRDGGIEFLHTGRQPLQYQDDISDGRFVKFTRDGDFGFSRLKRMHIIIYPSEDLENSRHAILNTYFMNLALCRLLQRCGDKRSPITRMTIDFKSKPAIEKARPTGRRAMMMRENYWWDPDRRAPRETSIHGLSNVELVLRPFANLSKCHQVDVYLPDKVDEHEKTKQYTQQLVDHMTSDSVFAAGFVDDRVDQQIESGRQALEEHIVHTLYGVGNKSKVDPLTAEELGYGYGDGETDDNPKKHELSPNRANSASKRYKSYLQGFDYAGRMEDGSVSDDDEDELLQRVLLESALATSTLEKSHKTVTATHSSSGPTPSSERMEIGTDSMVDALKLDADGLTVSHGKSAASSSVSADIAANGDSKLQLRQDTLVHRIRAADGLAEGGEHHKAGQSVNL